MQDKGRQDLVLVRVPPNLGGQGVLEEEQIRGDEVKKAEETGRSERTPHPLLSCSRVPHPGLPFSHSFSCVCDVCVWCPAVRDMYPDISTLTIILATRVWILLAHKHHRQET